MRNLMRKRWFKVAAAIVAAYFAVSIVIEAVRTAGDGDATSSGGALLVLAAVAVTVGVGMVRGWRRT